MNPLKNTFIIALIVLSTSTKAQIGGKRINFVDESYASASGMAIINNQDQLNKSFKTMFKQERHPLVLNKSLKAISPSVSANEKLRKGGLINRLIKSNLKLSFRVSGNFNMIISYT